MEIMNNSVDYHPVKYKDLQLLLNKKFNEASNGDKSAYYMTIALKIGKSTITVILPILQVLLHLF